MIASATLAGCAASGDGPADTRPSGDRVADSINLRLSDLNPPPDLHELDQFSVAGTTGTSILPGMTCTPAEKGVTDIGNSPVYTSQDGFLASAVFTGTTAALDQRINQVASSLTCYATALKAFQRSFDDLDDAAFLAPQIEVIPVSLLPSTARAADEVTDDYDPPGGGHRMAASIDVIELSSGQLNVEITNIQIGDYANTPNLSSTSAPPDLSSIADNALSVVSDRLVAESHSKQFLPASK